MVDRTIRIILDSQNAERNANSLDGSVRDVGRTADATTFSVNKLAAAIGSLIAVDKLKDFADAFRSIQNQIKRTTDNQEQLSFTTEKLLQLSNDTRTDLAATTELYTSLAVSTQKLGYSQEEIFGITKTLNNLFLESGKTAEESSGAIRQLGQALQSGALRGDEFNSIAEGAPGILRALQKETGKTAGELREFAATGGITAELLAKSLGSYSDAAQLAADKTKITFSQALTVAANNAINFVGQVNESIGVTDRFGKALIEISNRLSSQDNINNFLLFFKQAGKSIEQTTEALLGFDSQLSITGVQGADAIGLIGRSFRDLVPNVKSSVQLIVVEVASFIDRVSAKFKQFDEYLANFMDGDNAEKSLKNYENRINAITSARETSIQEIFRERDAVIDSANAEIKARNEAAKAGGDNSNFGIAGKGTAAAPKSDPKAAQARINTVDQINAEIDAEGKRMDIAEREIQSAQSVTEQLRIELEKRRQVSSAYREYSLTIDQGYFEQQRALQKAKQQEDIANVNSKSSQDAQRREEQLRQALDNENLVGSEILRVKAEYDSQKHLQDQVSEEQTTAIKEQGVRARAELDKAEFQSRLDNAGALGSALMSLGQGQSKKIFKIGQTLALAQAAVALPSAVLQSFQNGGGYPWGLVPAAAMLATGLKNIQQIRSAGAGLGGGGGGGGGAFIGGGSGASSIPTSSNSMEAQPQQKRIYDLRGVKADDKISVSAMAALLEDDGAIVMIESAREDAARRNVIGVTAR